jgi:hypothetical protein
MNIFLIVPINGNLNVASLEFASDLARNAKNGREATVGCGKKFLAAHGVSVVLRKFEMLLRCVHRRGDLCKNALESNSILTFSH